MADSKKYGRTANLFDYQTMEGTIKGYYLDSNGDLQESAFAAVTDYIPCSGGKFCLAKVGGISTSICLYDNNKHFLYGQAYNTSSGSDKQTIVVDTSVNASYIRFTYFYTAAPQDDLSAIMLNTGSTALPYEPYGWLHSLRKLTTATDTITTLPADLYADGTNATVGLLGNMTQTGTPTPQNPITPQECGERTGNLIDVNVSESGGITDTGELVDNPNAWRSTIYYDIDTTLNYVASKATQTIRINYYDASKNHISREAVTQETYRQLTVPSNARYFKWTLYDNRGIPDIQAARSIKPMVNLGSSPLPYQPYGYQLDIKSSNTTTPVYLGQVQSTRKIKKLVLTGEENWKYSTSSQVHWIENVPNDYDNTLFARITTVCTHYKCIQNNTGLTGMANGDLRLYAKATSPIAHELYIKDETYTSADDFKTYLQQQYANGTPVTVWYILATEETGIVNEPLRKIGDYADTVSDITIPTIAGKDTFDVLTTLKPSEVSLSYTGWHDASVKEWDGSQWQ